MTCDEASSYIGSVHYLTELRQTDPLFVHMAVPGSQKRLVLCVCGEDGVKLCHIAASRPNAVTWYVLTPFSLQSRRSG